MSETKRFSPEWISEQLEIAGKATPGRHQTRFIYRMIKAVRDNASALHLMLSGDGSQDWADAELWAAASNNYADLLRRVGDLEARDTAVKIVCNTSDLRTAYHLCGKCNASLAHTKGAAFCPNCGQRLEWK